MTRLLIAICVVAAGIGAAAQARNAVVRLDPALDGLIRPDAKAELLKGYYFGALEGPVSGDLSVFLDKSGYTGTALNNVGGQYSNGLLHLLVIGCNGLTLDREGRLIIAGMTDRNVARLEKDGTRTVLADRYDGKRLNSPNDVVAKSDGAIYFTETTSGIRGRDEGPAREIPFHGLIVAYDVLPDDTIANPHLIIDTSLERVGGNAHGMKVDRRGYIWWADAASGASVSTRPASGR